MTEKVFCVLECTNPNCRFRFSNEICRPLLVSCPRCKAPLLLVEEEFANTNHTLEAKLPTSRRIHAVLDGIRSTLNVGSMFRTADGAGIEHLYLCGLTATPEHPKLSKTGLGAEWNLPWSYHPNVLELVLQLKSEGFLIIALEGCDNSIPIYSMKDPRDQPVVVVVGNEVSGIDPSVLEMADARVFLPMAGYKRSLNVAVAFGIAVYTLQYQAKFLSL